MLLEVNANTAVKAYDLLATDEIYPNKEKVYELLDKIEGDRLPDDLIPGQFTGTVNILAKGFQAEIHAGVSLIQQNPCDGEAKL